MGLTFQWRDLASATASKNVSLFLVIMKSETRNRYFFAFCGKEFAFVARLMASPRSVRPEGPERNRFKLVLKVREKLNIFRTCSN